MLEKSNQVDCVATGPWFINDEYWNLDEQLDWSAWKQKTDSSPFPSSSSSSAAHVTSLDQMNSSSSSALIATPQQEESVKSVVN